MIAKDKFVVKIFSTIFFMFFWSLCYSQAPNIQWQNRYGGVQQDSQVGLIKDNDGFLFTGSSNSPISGDKTENSKGGYDYWIVKIDENGIKLWDKTIGGANPMTFEHDFLTCSLKKTNSYVFGGYSNSPISGDKSVDAFNQSNDFWIFETDLLGAIQWQKVFGGNNSDTPTVIKSTIDGGYIIGGYSQSGISGNKTENSRGLNDYWVLKLNSIGDIEWQKTIGGNAQDYLEDIYPTTDDGYLLFGSSNSPVSGDKTELGNGLFDLWIVKISSNGIIEWQKTIGGSQNDNINKILSLNNSNYLLAFYSDSPVSGDKTAISKGLMDYWLLEVDPIGNIVWQKTYGGSQNDYVSNILTCSDGGYLLSGSSDSPISGDKTEGSQGALDAWLIKVDPVGQIIWQKTIGGSSTDGLTESYQTPDGGYFLSGSTASPVSGDITIPARGQNDYWAVKLYPDNLSINEPQSLDNIILYPNPVSDVINLENSSSYLVENITIYAVNGAVVKKFSKEEVLSPMAVSDLPSGFYFAKIAVGDTVLNYRIVKL